MAMGYIGDEVIQLDEIVEEEFFIVFKKIYVRIYQASKSDNYYFERSVNANFKVLIFDISFISEYVFRFNKIIFYLKIKIV